MGRIGIVAVASTILGILLVSCAQEVRVIPIGSTRVEAAGVPSSDLELCRAIAAVPPAARSAWLRERNITLTLEGFGDSTLERIWIASEWRVSGLPKHASAAGKGIAVALQLNASPQAAWTKFLPPEGFFVAATGLVERRAGAARLRLVNPNLARTELHLATDDILPFALLTERAHVLARSGFSGMVQPARSQRSPAVYLLDPYDPRKIPLLMVHGLQSTPVNFARLVAALRADPRLQSRYQIWQYHYPTGTPVLANAENFRRVLNAALRTIDPAQLDFAMRHLVVLGHSMGGILIHTLVSSSGHALWDAISNVPAERLRGDKRFIRHLQDLMFFERDRRMARAIFLSTPHRGSALADNVVGRIGKLFVTLPDEYATGYASLAGSNPTMLRPEIVQFYRSGGLSSIQTLSPRSLALLALAERPIAVPFHSIIGQKSAGPPESGSDGVVTYRSSHLAGAASEKIVRSGHSSMDSPGAVAEVLRILRMQAGQKSED